MLSVNKTHKNVGLVCVLFLGMRIMGAKTNAWEKGRLYLFIHNDSLANYFLTEYLVGGIKEC